MRFISKLLLFVSLISYAYSYKYTKKQEKRDIYKGKQYLKKHEINLAIAAFERVLMFDPNNDVAKFYLGIIFEKENDINLAKKYFESIKHPTPYMKKKILEFHRKYEKYDITLLFGANFDTNINNTSCKDLELTLVSVNSEKVNAFSLYQFISISPHYLKNSTLDHTILFFNKNTIDHSQNDIQLLSYIPSKTQHYKKYNFKHYTKYDFVMYGGEPYLNKFTLGETIDFNIQNNHKNVINLMIAYNRYYKYNQQNSYQIIFNDKFIKYFDTHNMSILLGIESNQKEFSKAINVSYNKYKIDTNLNLNIKEFYIQTNINYDATYYKNEDPYFLKKRIDRKVDYIFNINLKHNNTIYQLQTEYTQNISNIDPYSYNKVIISLNLIKHFKTGL